MPDAALVAWDHFRAGGWIMAPLAVVSVWMWLLILVKTWQIWRWRLFLRDREGRPAMDDRLDLEVWRIRTGRRLDRHVGVILVLAGLAPLIGLLGTVGGMVAAFEVIAVHGAGQAKSLAAGISEALITTQTGLTVALPGLFMGNFIRRRVDRLKDRLDRLCLNRAAWACDGGSGV